MADSVSRSVDYLVNVNNVIRRELGSAEYHTVILGAPLVDINNQEILTA